jgi:hypothetical protein
MALLRGPPEGPARLHRQTVRTLRRLADRIGLETRPLEPLPPELVRIGYDRMAAAGLEMHSFDEALATVSRLRSEYHPTMEAFISELVAPRGFWGVTSAETPIDVDPRTA